MLDSLQVRVPKNSACFVKKLITVKGNSAYYHTAYFPLNKYANNRYKMIPLWDIGDIF